MVDQTMCEASNEKACPLMRAAYLRLLRRLEGSRKPIGKCGWAHHRASPVASDLGLLRRLEGKDRGDTR